jgi:hypothetical protein
MTDRSRLHELVDTLPDEAIALAQGSLEHLQTWPPQEPAQARELRDQHAERMRGQSGPAWEGAAVEAVTTDWGRAADLSTATSPIVTGRVTRLL